MALANYKDCRIRMALLKKDTCYVIETMIDPLKMTRHAIFELSRRNMPDYIQPDVYSKTCEGLKFIQNRNIIYTSKVYSWGEISYQK